MVLMSTSVQRAPRPVGENVIKKGINKRRVLVYVYGECMYVAMSRDDTCTLKILQG